MWLSDAFSLKESSSHKLTPWANTICIFTDFDDSLLETIECKSHLTSVEA